MAININKLIRRTGYVGATFVTRAIIAAVLTLTALTTNAQSVEQVRWKSEQQVRNILGEPQSKSTPIGTHASYSLWNYGDFTVAFANNRAFHLFKKGSLKKVVLEEDRPN